MGSKTVNIDNEAITADETTTEKNTQKLITVRHLEDTEDDEIKEYDLTSGATIIPRLSARKRKQIVRKINPSNLSQSESSEINGYTTTRKIPKKRSSIIKNYASVPRNFDPMQPYSNSRNEVQMFLENQNKTV